VRYWLANATQRRNHGWTFIGNETGPYTVKVFASRHYTENAAWLPSLNIVYDIEPANDSTSRALEIALPIVAFLVLLVAGGIYISRRQQRVTHHILN